MLGINGHDSFAA